MFETEWLSDLDAAGACAAVLESQELVLQGQVQQFYLAAHWADLHSEEMVVDSWERTRAAGRGLPPGAERARQLGADGTPKVAEFAAAELGALLGMGHVAADHLVRDALDVRHRHPRLWGALAEGRGRVWQARKVARMCAEARLDLEQAQWVDEQTTDYVGSLPWGRLEALVSAKIIEVDPAAAEDRRKTAALRRFVRSGQSSEYGLKLLVAKANAGDVIFFVAVVDRIAQVLAMQGDEDPVDVRRSKAIGILATPARALLLLTSATCEAGGESHDDGGESADGGGAAAEDPETVSEGDVHPSQNDADDPTDPTDPAARSTCHACGGVGAVDPRRLLPKATLYIHLSEDTLTRGAGGVARFEGVGPITREQVVEFLRHTNVRVVPVRDLADQQPVDGYEVPTVMAEALHLINPVCVSPWSTNLSRRKDKDHVVPYVPRHLGGPSRQTRIRNLALLGRFAHRLKTHGRWQLRQTAPGTYEWRSPHGYRFRVDHNGTHRLN